MYRYLATRLLASVVTLLGTATVLFFLLQLSGDPASLLLPPEATREEIAAFRRARGFDDPILVQYLRFLGQLARGDLGDSLRYPQSALSLVLERLPVTLQLAVAAFAIALVVALPGGVIAALRPNSPLDLAARFCSLIGQGVPVFWIGLLLILGISVQLKLLPSSGAGTPAHLVLPALSLSVYTAASLFRMLRASLLEVLDAQYITTAHAKGLRERRVALRHALPNAILPTLTLAGMELGSLLGGAVVTETVFAWPGIGRLMVQAIAGRDFPVVQASVLVVSSFFLLINLVVDIAYALLDPRVRYA